MKNKEVFIIGKPPILLHSKDAGKSWERVPLSPKVIESCLVESCRARVFVSINLCDEKEMQFKDAEV